MALKKKGSKRVGSITVVSQKEESPNNNEGIQKLSFVEESETKLDEIPSVISNDSMLLSQLELNEFNASSVSNQSNLMDNIEATELLRDNSIFIPTETIPSVFSNASMLVLQLEPNEFNASFVSNQSNIEITESLQDNSIFTESVNHIDVNDTISSIPKSKKVLAKRTGSVTIVSKPSYPIINHNVSQVLPEINNNIALDNDDSWNGLLIVGGIGVVTLIAASGQIKQSIKTQLGAAIGTKTLANSLMNDYGLGLFLKNQEQLMAIDNIADIRAKNIIKLSNSFVYQAAGFIKTSDQIADVVELAYEPNISNLEEVAINLNNLHTIYNGPSFYSTAISTSYVAHMMYQGEYLHAIEQAATASSYILIQNYPGYALVALLGSGCISAVNAHISLKEYMNDSGYVMSMIAYKEFIHVLSKTYLAELYDFTSLEKSQGIKINNARLNIEMENIRQFFDGKGKFAQKLSEYIYTPVVKEKYELLNKVAQGYLTQEELSSLLTKHVVIELENRAYDHCIEIKSTIPQKNIDNYYCYNNELEIIDHVVIGANNTVIAVENLYS